MDILFQWDTLDPLYGFYNSTPDWTSRRRQFSHTHVVRYYVYYRPGKVQPNRGDNVTRGDCQHTNGQCLRDLRVYRATNRLRILYRIMDTAYTTPYLPIHNTHVRATRPARLMDFMDVQWSFFFFFIFFFTSSSSRHVTIENTAISFLVK